MSAGLGRLRLSPRAFWSMTPRELAAAIAGLDGIALQRSSPSRADLERLCRAFPDIAS